VKALAALLLSGALLCACQIPQDVDGTTDRIRRDGVLRAGISQSDPFVILEPGRPPAGAEVRLVERFARTLGARVEWVEGSEQELADAVKEGSVDVLAAGLTSKSQLKKEVAFTKPYLTTETIVGIPPGATLDKKLTNVRIAAEKGTEAVGLAERKTKGLIVPVDSLANSKGSPAAIGEWLLSDLGLVPSGTVLKRDKHVMAVKLGENELLVDLERFLLRREQLARGLAAQEGRP
jgi:polar amino acid transport system substrate-binding protein